MRTELEKLRAEKIILLAEIEELKRRLGRAEVERREFDACRARLERERLTLKRNIETVNFTFFFSEKRKKIPYFSDYYPV
ncbi:unnamed protein product [Onchocerca flexuosa]|uniref:Transposase n=1 Tax=Onchocerca flexuosa TaxID=387005 RepID=A0A183HXC1_9BILA|nr:unnamed protein product [Onchocerca flexuosa]